MFELLLLTVLFLKLLLWLWLLLLALRLALIMRRLTLLVLLLVPLVQKLPWQLKVLFWLLLRGDGALLLLPLLVLLVVLQLRQQLLMRGLCKLLRCSTYPSRVACGLAQGRCKLRERLRAPNASAGRVMGPRCGDGCIAFLFEQLPCHLLELLDAAQSVAACSSHLTELGGELCTASGQPEPCCALGAGLRPGLLPAARG